VWDALEHGFPDRIGHGTSLFRDPVLVRRFQEQGIHLEICPTSSLRTGSVERLEDHPVRLARELGLNFSISTDDPGLFECSMESEHQLLATTFRFQEADFRRLGENALGARFQPRLRHGIAKDLIARG
jgi:adenosine deaminase